jgi:hypothetical protein
MELNLLPNELVCKFCCFCSSFCVLANLFSAVWLCRKFSVKDGQRYFWEARYITAYFDASPQCLSEVNRLLRNEGNVIRNVAIKMDTAHDRVTADTYKNPYFFEKTKPDWPK